MWRGISAAVSAAAIVATALESPASAGEWAYDPASDLVLYESVPIAPWYGQPPLAGTGPGHYYSHHPRHVPAYPEWLTGYPVPIYKTPPGMPALRGAVVRVHRARSVSHMEWCAARHRSYDAATDTYQPYEGPRRVCRSPFP